MLFLPDFQKRSTDDELMDDPNCDQERLLRTIDQFKSINRLVSRYKTILHKWVLEDMKTTPETSRHLIDMGAGGCDIDVWLLKEAKRLGLKLKITACDYDLKIIQHARKTYGEVENLEISHIDLLKDIPSESVDYVFANHFLHHLSEEQIKQLLQNWHPHVTRHMLFSDLKRAALPYIGYALLSIFYKNSFARYDGLLSIRKGFKKGDMLQIAKNALQNAQLSEKSITPGRYLLKVDALTKMH